MAWQNCQAIVFFITSLFIPLGHQSVRESLGVSCGWYERVPHLYEQPAEPLGLLWRKQVIGIRIAHHMGHDHQWPKLDVNIVARLFHDAIDAQAADLLHKLRLRYGQFVHGKPPFIAFAQVPRCGT